MTINRRQALNLGLGATFALAAQNALGGSSEGNLLNVGPLRAPDANGVRLPKGFTSRIVARSGTPPVAGKPFLWHFAPDGGATFPAPDGGWVYVSNAEVGNNLAGASALRFAGSGELIDAYPILTGTNGNCAGGHTPWGTWLSCEEHGTGLVWECDPLGKKKARALPALGAFTHEAVAVDPKRHHLYLTEDMPKGRFYRFTPDRVGADKVPDLATGTLEAAEIPAEPSARVRWHRIADPSGKPKATRLQAPQSSAFNGGEGCWYDNDLIYFTTKGDNRVWTYDIRRESFKVIYDGKLLAQPTLTGVDNVTVTTRGDILVCEDRGDMQIVVVQPDQQVVPLLQVAGHEGSETAGVALDPSGTRLYFSSQRGPRVLQGTPRAGFTFEITGPFNG